jgi:hypothetical protein
VVARPALIWCACGVGWGAPCSKTLFEVVDGQLAQHRTSEMYFVEMRTVAFDGINGLLDAVIGGAIGTPGDRDESHLVRRARGCWSRHVPVG